MALENGLQNGTWKQSPIDLETLVIAENSKPGDFKSKPLVVPIVSSGIFLMDYPSYGSCISKSGDSKPYFHSRKGNPTRNALENLLAKLEGCEYALALSSGSAAINCVLQSILLKGGHVVSMETVYGGTTAILNDFKKYGVSISYDNSFDAKTVGSLVKDSTKIVWIESPANPTLQLIDIEETVKIVKRRNPSTLVVVDNTFLTPVFQRPLDLGADISVYSCSKYLGGHSDIVMGSIACKSESVFKCLLQGQEVYGAVPSPNDCYMLLRSLKTLPLRMKQHYQTSLKVAEFLEDHPCVKSILYPGLKSHPHHGIALKQQFGVSGAIGIYLNGGKEESTTFLRSLRLINLAPSIGTDMSVANLPAEISHWKISFEEKQRLGITDNYIRLSIGLESAQGLIEDLDQALRKSISV